MQNPYLDCPTYHGAFLPALGTRKGAGDLLLKRKGRL